MSHLRKGGFIVVHSLRGYLFSWWIMHAVRSLRQLVILYLQSESRENLYFDCFAIAKIRLRAALINGKLFRRYSHPLSKNNSSCLLGSWPPKLWTLDQIYSEVCSVEQAWNLVREHSPEPLCHYWTSTHMFAWQADHYRSMPGALLNFPGQFQLISLYPVTRVYCIFGTR